MTGAYTTWLGARVRPIGNHVLVRINDEREVTRGGIVVPKNVLPSLYHTGQVVAMGRLTGSRARDVAIPGLEVGQHVLFVRFHEKTGGNAEIAQILGEPVVCIRPADILLVMDGPDVQRVG